MKKPRILTISADTAEQRVADGWNYARQRDFSGGESLAKLPERVGRNQLIRMENAIISPEGLITECWQTDKPLFTNVTSGVVLVSVPGSKLWTVYAVSAEGIISFTVDPASSEPYDLAAPTGYPGYALRPHANATTILGITHGTPFLGKNYCSASSNLYISAGELSIAPSPVAFGTVQIGTVNQTNVTVTNSTENTVTINGLTLDGSSAVGHQGAFPQTIPAGETYTFAVTYNPSAAGASNVVASVLSNVGILQFTVTGTAETMFTATPSELDLPNLDIEEAASVSGIVTLSNTGTRTVNVTSMTFSGTAASAFTCSIDSNLGDGIGSPAPIYAGRSAVVHVTFTPPTTGDYLVTLRIKTDIGLIEVPISAFAYKLLPR